MKTEGSRGAKGLARPAGALARLRTAGSREPLKVVEPGRFPVRVESCGRSLV